MTSPWPEARAAVRGSVRSFLPASPVGGRHRVEPLAGDTHAFRYLLGPPRPVPQQLGHDLDAQFAESGHGGPVKLDRRPRGPLPGVGVGDGGDSGQVLLDGLGRGRLGPGGAGDIGRGPTLAGQPISPPRATPLPAHRGGAAQGAETRNPSAAGELTVSTVAQPSDV